MKDFGEILLGEGILTYNNGATDVEIGFTRGGTFNDNIDIRHVEADGKKGNTKGDAIIQECSPTLDFAIVQMNASVLELIFANVTAADATGIKTLTRKTGVIAADQYLANVMYVGQKMDGKDITVKLLNALGEGPFNFAYNDKGEVEVPCMFTGNYGDSTETDAPFEIILDEAV